MASSEKRSATARSAATGKKKRSEPTTKSAKTKSAKRTGTKTRGSKSLTPASYNVDDLVAAVTPLLELFAVCDDVFTEDEALTTARQVTLGRIYEEWQRTRLYFDPTFVAAEHRRPRKWRYKPE